MTPFEVLQAARADLDLKDYLQEARRLRARYTIEICDSMWQPLGQLGHWDNLTMVHRVCDIGTGAIDAAATAANRALIAVGATVLVSWDGEVRQAGILKTLGEAEQSASIIKVDWVDTMTYAAVERAYPNPVFEGDERTDGQGINVFDARSGFASTVVLGFIAANIGPGVVGWRQAPGLALGPDPGAGVFLEVPILARYENLLELCRNIALPNGIVFEIVTRDRSHYFNVRAARDLSDRICFSRKLNNVGDGSWSLTAPTATRITVLGPGEGTGQMIFEVTTPDSLEQERRWGRSFRDTLESSSIVKDPAAAAELEAAKSVLALKSEAAEAAVALTQIADRAATVADRDLADAMAGEYDSGPVAAASTALQAANADFDDATADAAAANPPTALQQAAVTATRSVLAVLENQLNEAKVEMQGQLNAMRAIITVRQNELQDRRNVEFAAKTEEANAAILVGFLEGELYKRDWENTLRSLRADAERKLSEKGETVEASYAILDGTFVFGVDYGMGDLVAVHPEGLAEPIVKPVREYTESVSVANGRRVVPVVGDYGATSGTGSSFTTRELISTVRRLQARR